MVDYLASLLSRGIVSPNALQRVSYRGGPGNKSPFDAVTAGDVGRGFGIGGASGKPTVAPDYGMTTAGGRVIRPPSDPDAYISDSEYRDALRSNYFKGDEKIASSREQPVTNEMPPVGSWRKSEMNGIHGHDIEHLTKIPIEELELPELEAGKLDPIKRGDDARYAEWLRQGKRAPPIEVVETEGGNLKVMDGHRRALAAKLAGHKDVEAWISYTVPHPEGLVASNGKPMWTGLTYEMAK